MRKTYIVNKLGNWGALNYLLATMAVIFVVNGVLVSLFHTDILYKIFALNVHASWAEKIIQSVTYMFMHGEFMHILFNCIVLYFMGRYVEMRYGSRRMLNVFLLSGIVGAAFWLIVNIHHPQASLIGASAGCLGLFAYFCMSYENRPVTFLLFFILPVTLKPRLLLSICGGIEFFYFLTQELPGGNVANSAHLGGMLGGILIYGFYQYRRQIFNKVERKVTYRSRSVNAMHGDSYQLYITSYSAQRDEIDRILDKINATGFQSLSEEERKTLNRAKHLVHR